ncbi:MAG: carbohydrate kinase [Anaerolineaceae bacterium]|nr:carbohydrate kinase [Anaerolineaceae bacterium]
MTLLVIDAGSSSVRALLVDDAGQPLLGAVARRFHEFHTDHSGAVTADAAALRDRLEACIDDILRHPQAGTIRAVGMASFVGNLVGLKKGIPITPLYTYADTQPAEAVAYLRSLVDTAAAHQRTGCPQHTAYHPARLRWLKQTQPEIFAAVDCWTDFATTCYRTWFGRDVPCSYSVASWSGLFNRATLGWDAEWLNVLGLAESLFSPLADFTAAQTGLTGDYAARWPSLRDVPFFLAVGDGAAANIGSGGTDRAHPVLTVGTTAALRLVTEETLPPVPSGLWVYRVDARRHLIGGATSEGGNIFDWAGRTLQLPDAETVERELTNCLPDGHGLVFLPLLAGERSPGWAVDATGGIHGLRLGTTPLDILQAALEGVALRLSLVADRLGLGDAPLFAGGGALVGSPAWAQIIANALGRSLHVLAEEEVTARGVALLLLKTLDGLDAPPPSIQRVYQPDSAAVNIYQKARERQVAFYGLFT